MNPGKFDHLLSLVKDKITKENAKFRKSISAEERLEITLRILATGRTTVGKALAENLAATHGKPKSTYIRHRPRHIIGYVFQNSLKVHKLFRK